MNFCVTDGVSVVATRYVSSRNDAAASLVCIPFLGVINTTVVSHLVVVLFGDDLQ
jgi:hypothetical protein